MHKLQISQLLYRKETYEKGIKVQSRMSFYRLFPDAYSNAKRLLSIAERLDL